MIAKKVFENIPFERGNIGNLVGLTKSISTKWEEIVQTRQGSISVEKWRSTWYLVYQTDKSFKEAMNLIQDLFGKYINFTSYFEPEGNTKIWSHELVIPIKPEFKKYFIEAHNLRYPSNKIEESINFERGQDPKKSMRLGKYKSLIRIAFEDPDNRVDDFDGGFTEWIYDNPLLKSLLKLNRGTSKETPEFYCFDIDNYCEMSGVDRGDLESEFIPTSGKREDPKPGACSVIQGKLKDGSKLLYYQAELIDGYITRKDWLR